MKTFSVLAIAALWAAASPAAPPVSSADTPPAVANTNDSANYLISVQWKDTKMGSSFVQLMTAEGPFNLDALEHNTMKINGPEVPTALKLSGALTVLSPEKGRLKLSISRTVPYMMGQAKESRTTTPSSSYRQLPVGLDSTFIVTFGKPLVIQGDENGQISIQVKRDEG